MRRELFLVLLSLVAVGACKSGPSAPPPELAPAAPPGTQDNQAEQTPMPKVENYQVTQNAQPQTLVFPEEEFRGTQPTAGPPRPFRLPKVAPFKLKTGIQVYLVEQHTLPLVSLDLNFAGGGTLDPIGKEGLASVCTSMLTEGTESLDKIQYAEALGDIASNINSYATDDAHGLALNSLSKHLDSTFALFVDTLQRPGFRQSDFDRMISRRIESVKQQKGNPASVAGRVAGTILYGEKHPYGGVVTEASLRAITLDDCKTFAKSRLAPGNAKLFVVGDLTEAQVRALFEGPALASWKGTSPKVAALPAPKAPKGRIFFVNVPGAAQSQVWMMHAGPKRTAADYLATSMLGSVYGGGFSSRINMNLREDKGYSYGARGGYSYTKEYGTFTASASVRTDSTYQTVLEIVREAADIKAGKPVKADELDREKQGAILGLPGRFSTGQGSLAQYRTLVYYGLPLDYFSSYVDKIGKVTVAQVGAAAKKQLKPELGVFLVVGDGAANVVVRKDGKDVPLEKDGKPVTLRAALTDLAERGDVGKGGLVELDTDGKPLR